MVPLSVAHLLVTFHLLQLLSAIVLFIFALWLAGAWIIRNPRSRLKNDLRVALWGAFPLLVSVLVVQVLWPVLGYSPAIPKLFVFAQFISIYGVVYILLYIPAVIREFFSDARFAVDPLSLRLPAAIIAFTSHVILYQIIEVEPFVLIGLLVCIVLLVGWFFGYLPFKIKLRFKEAKKRPSRT
jgi:hypothetical protein